MKKFLLIIFGLLIGWGLALYAAPVHAEESLPAATVIGTENTAVLKGALDTLLIMLDQVEGRLANTENPIPNKDEVVATLGSIRQNLTGVRHTIAVLEDKARAIAQKPERQPSPQPAAAQAEPQATALNGEPIEVMAPAIPEEVSQQVASVKSTFETKNFLLPSLVVLLVAVATVVYFKLRTPKVEAVKVETVPETIVEASPNQAALLDINNKQPI